MQLINIPTLQQVIRYVAVGENEPVAFWGPPGCGKSEGVRAAAKADDAQLIEIRLGQYDSIDMRGLPDLSNDTTVWRIPSTIPFVGNSNFDPDRKKYLFFDEANGAKPAVLGNMYQIVQERRCGEHVLMPNTYLMMAGNRDGDKGVTTKMPTPLMNKTTHYEVGPDAKSWVAWAATQPRIPAEVLALLSFRPDLITDFDPTDPEKSKVFATPRTWEKASRYFTSDMPEDVRDASIEGAIGKDSANWFFAFCKTTKDLISVDEIEKDPLGTPISDKGEARWMTAVGIGGTMAQRPASVAALNQYLDRMDPDMTVVAWQVGLGKNEDLIGAPEFLAVAKKHQAIFAPIAKSR